VNPDHPLAFSVVICTYGRTDLCRQAVTALLPQVNDRGEILIVAQAVTRSSRDLYCAPEIPAERVRCVFLNEPNMLRARNAGIQESRGAITIFLDDDIIPDPGLIAGHLGAYADPAVGGVAGRILSELEPPSERLDPLALDPHTGWWHTNFDHREHVPLMTARGCNMSFRRTLLVEIGGFDRLYRWFRDDSDVSFRVRSLGYLLVFRPEAELLHLDAKQGGTRALESRGGRVAAELLSYRRYLRHYGDNLYFIARHFHGRERWRWVWHSYRVYVGLSRWPWRLFAKNLCFLLALLRGHYLAATSQPPYFEPVGPG
jgi:GT2 family glycosyltransferase